MGWIPPISRTFQIGWNVGNGQVKKRGGRNRRIAPSCRVWWTRNQEPLAVVKKTKLRCKWESEWATSESANVAREMGRGA